MSTVLVVSRAAWDKFAGLAVLAMAVMLGLTVSGCGRWQENPVVAAEKNSETASLEPMAPQGQDEANPTDKRQKRRVPAPELKGGTDWLNTAGPLQLADLRGKIVILDFWTFCCINCIHTLPDLAKLEKKYANQLVVVGVHSAKFDNEKKSENIRKAILRYEISHPVVNDANMTIWNTYGVMSWPTLVLIDPEGLVAGSKKKATTPCSFREKFWPMAPVGVSLSPTARTTVLLLRTSTVKRSPLPESASRANKTELSTKPLSMIRREWLCPGKRSMLPTARII